MNNLWINEQSINKTENCYSGESEPYETFTDNAGILFRSLQKGYGKCISKLYVDSKDSKSIQVGWVFSKKMKYEDCNEYFISETWVTVYKGEPIKSVSWKYEYAF